MKNILLYLYLIFSCSLSAQECDIEIIADDKELLPGQSLSFNLKLTSKSKTICYPYITRDGRFFRRCKAQFKSIMPVEPEIHLGFSSTNKYCVEGAQNAFCIKSDSAYSVSVDSWVFPTSIDDFDGKSLELSVVLILQECLTSNVDTVVRRLKYRTAQLKNIEKAFWKKAITLEPRKFRSDTVKFITIHYDAQRFEPFLNKCRKCSTYPLAIFQKLQYLAYGPIRTVISIESENTDVVLDENEISKRKELIKQVKDRLEIDKGQYFYPNLVDMYKELISRGWNRKKSRYVTFEEFQNAQKLSATQ